MEKQYRVKNAQCFNPYSVLPILKDLTDKHQMLSKINEISKVYEENKQLLKLKNDSSTSLNLFNSNIAEEIINDIQKFEEQKRNQQIKSMFDSEKACSSSTSKGTHKKTQLYVNLYVIIINIFMICFLYCCFFRLYYILLFLNYIILCFNILEKELPNVKCDH